jgi:RimJ/RimL family protein N-acetyltransferase
MAAAPGIVVQRLNARHRQDIARHLLQLPANDRRLRFGNQIRDEAVRSYAEGIDFERDRVFGVLNAGLDLIGVAHLALDPLRKTAELGLSVHPAARGRGCGFALLQRSVLHAANLGYRTLFMYCLGENGVMLHLAEKAGLSVVIEAGEADARLQLDRGRNGGFFKEAIADQFALVDTMLKQQYLWLA